MPMCDTANLTPSTSAHTHSNSRMLRFAQPLTDEQIMGARQAGIPQSTKKDTKYCVNIWEEWSKQRQQTTNTTIPPLATMESSHIAHWMTRFILEARKKSGDPYPPNTLHHIVTGLMRYLRWSGREIDLLKDVEFHEFRALLDSEMKRLQTSEEEEDIL